MMRSVELNAPDAYTSIGILGTFDGETWQTAALAVEHIQALIERDDQDSFLWVRLGNLYLHGGCPEKADEAYRKALELDETDIEGHVQLAQLLAEGERFDEAVRHFHAVLTHARGAKRVPKELRYKLVQGTLEWLFRINELTDGGSPIFPEITPKPSDHPDEPAVLEVFEFELSRESDWKRMCAMFIEDRPKTPWSPFRRRPSHRDADLPPILSLHGVGRNRPCPCGSGQKYKRCCGKTRLVK